MKTPSEIFKGRAFEVFNLNEINEVLLIMYKELSLAIRDSSESLILSSTSLTHYSQGRITSELPMIYGDTSIYDISKISLIKILERDDLVQQHFQLDKIDADGIEVKHRT